MQQHPILSRRNMVALFIISNVICVAGAWLKILHLRGADWVLTISIIGTLFSVVAISYLMLRKRTDA